ncbi:hypothetical protein BH23BAC3_BH23BAC3_24590 [soil metagenome]
MKIAICSHDYPNDISGPNVWLERITSFFQKKGIESVVLFTKGNYNDEYRYITALRKKNIPLYVYSGDHYTEHKLKWIVEILNKEKPDIFIPNYDLPGLFASKWVREAGIPTIGTMRSDYEEYMAKLELFVRTKNGFTLDAMVCVSEYLAGKSRTQAHNTIIRRIPSGTPIPDKKAENSNGVLRLIYSGKIAEKQKRISDVTTVLCETIKRIPGTEAVIYGSGTCIQSVQNIIREKGKDLPISYGGVLNSDEVQNEMLNSQVFVLLSDYEGLPTALMEAMACGLVPVCLNIDSGVPELIEHNKTGLLVNDRGEDFIRAIKRLKTEEGLWEKLSNAARTKIASEYSIEYSFNNWIKLFDDLLEKKTVEKREIRIPSRLELPKIHPELTKAEHRWPGTIPHLMRLTNNYVKRFASRCKSGVQTLSFNEK